MGDKRIDDGSESEFGLGSGMLDPGERQDRSLPLHQQLSEIYALPKTFDAEANGIDIGKAETTPVPRLLPNEKEADRA